MSQLLGGDFASVFIIKESYFLTITGTCAFGINCNSLTDPNAEFRTMGKRVFDLPGSIMVKHFFMSSFKHLAIALRMRGVHKDVSTFFLGIVKETVEYREKHNVKRNDFMDLLIQLKNHGTLDGADVGKLSMNEIAAQVKSAQSCIIQLKK